jgi:hypothetical protein
MTRFPETLRAADGDALFSWFSGAKVVNLYAGGTNCPRMIREWIRWLEDALVEIDPPAPPSDPPSGFWRCPQCNHRFFHQPDCPIRIESGDVSHGLRENW